MSKAINILKNVGAITVNSHVVLTTGRHSDGYINLDKLMPHTEDASEMGKLFAEKYQNMGIDVVAGPAVGGIILSQWVAYHLSKLKNKEILSVFAEKDNQKNQILDRGFDKLVKGKKVLVVEDFTTTGGSVKKVVDEVKRNGGKVIATCVILNREPDKVNSDSIGAPFDSLDVFIVQSWGEEECPMCEKKVPINTEVGHGKEFLQKKGLL